MSDMNTKRTVTITLHGEGVDLDVYEILLAELDSAFADEDSELLCIEIDSDLITSHY